MALDIAIADLKAFLAAQNIDTLPLIAAGHSVGSAGLLKLGLELSNIEKYFLIAPGFDSREAIICMYESGTVQGFIDMLADLTEEKDALYEALLVQYLRARAKITSHFCVPSSGHSRQILKSKNFEIAHYYRTFCSSQFVNITLNPSAKM